MSEPVDRCPALHPAEPGIRCEKRAGHDGLHVHAFSAWSSRTVELTYSPTDPNQHMAATLVDIRARCGNAVARGGEFWQEFMADAERRTGLPWMRIKALLDEQHANEARRIAGEIPLEDSAAYGDMVERDAASGEA